MNTHTLRPKSAHLGLIVAITTTICASALLFLALSTPSHAEPGAPAITPTSVGANDLAPRFFRVGSADTRIGVRTLGSASAGASAIVHWNGQPLVTTRVADVMYEAIVPSALLSTTGTAVVTVTGSGASGWSAVTVFILDAPPAPAPPLSVSISALPGLVSNANLDNDILMTVTDTTGAPVLNLTNT